MEASIIELMNLRVELASREKTIFSCWGAIMRQNWNGLKVPPCVGLGGIKSQEDQKILNDNLLSVAGIRLALMRPLEGTTVALVLDAL